MTFSIYKEPAGGTALWTETWEGNRAVAVNNGQFSVMLGSQKAIPQSIVNGTDTLYLGVTIGNDEEMNPRLLLGSAPYAFQSLTVPDGSITTAKIADGAVSTAKLATKAVGSAQLADGAVGTAQIADGAVDIDKLNDNVGLPLLSGEGADYANNCCTTLAGGGEAAIQDIPGTESTFVVEVPSTLLINAVFDFNIPGNGGAIGTIKLNGNKGGRQAILSGTGRSTASTTLRFDLSPGTHTVNLAAYSDIAGIQVLHHTGYTYLVFAR
jgi:hypothetical protein